MRKKVLIASLAMLCISLIICVFLFWKDTGVLKEGMSWDDIIALHDEHKIVAVYDIIFCKNKKGDSVIAYMDKNDKLTDLTVYPKREATPENFSKVKEGMTIKEVTALIGIPTPATLSAFGCVYKLTDGTKYTFLLYGSDERVIITTISKHPD